MFNRNHLREGLYINDALTIHLINKRTDIMHVQHTLTRIRASPGASRS